MGGKGRINLRGRLYKVREGYNELSTVARKRTRQNSFNAELLSSRPGADFKPDIACTPEALRIIYEPAHLIGRLPAAN